MIQVTDSIDFTQFLGKAVSSNVTAVCGFFTFGSILYLIATINMSEQRWKWLEQSYSDLKANYNDILDDQDIEEAFNHDQPINTAKLQFKKFRSRMMRLWIAMIIGLGVFTGILYTSGKSTKEPANIVNENRTETTVGTSSEEVSETDPSENN